VHCANERTNIASGGVTKLKRMGVRAGVSDILIFESGWNEDEQDSDYNYYYGLAVELKVKPNKTTNKQVEFLERIEKSGWKTSVCFSFDEAKKIIDEYLGD